MKLTPEERELIYLEELEKRKKLEKITQKERDEIFQQEATKRDEVDLKKEQLDLDINIPLQTDIPHEKPNLYYKDLNLIPPPIRNGVTGVIGGIWFFGMLFLFGFMGLIWAIAIAIAAFSILVMGLRNGNFPPEWNIPYFIITCPKCYSNIPFFMNEQTQEYHPESNHIYELDCDSCGQEFTMEYEYTGSYDAQWDKFR